MTVDAAGWEDDSASAERSVVSDGPSVGVSQGPNDPSTSTRSAVKSVLKSAGVRFIALPMTAVLGIFSTRLVVENFGRDIYAQYGLLVAIGALIPFADLGMATAIMNAVGGSRDPAKDEYVERVLVTSIRVLATSGLVMIAISGLITMLGLWPDLLGEVASFGGGGTGAAGVLIVMGITMPIAFGSRVLTGYGKNHVTIALLGLQTPIVLLLLFVITRRGWWGLGPYLAIIPYLVMLFLQVCSTLLASRWLRPMVGRAVRNAFRFRRVKGEKVFDVAWPTLVQMVALPIAMQTDRLVLSHVTNGVGLPEYNLGSQMFNPVWQVVTAGGVALWPVFARHRAQGDQVKNSPEPLAVGFAVAAAVACLGISVFSGWLARISSGGEIQLSLGVLLSFSALMILQAAKYPLGVYMTDAKGLRYQAFFIVFMIPVNLGLSIVLAKYIGVTGPIIGSALGVLLCQVIPNSWYVRTDLRRLRRLEEHRSASGDGPRDVDDVVDSSGRVGDGVRTEHGRAT